MITTAKIKIEDNFELRDALDSQYQLATQHELSQFANSLVNHVLEMIEFDNTNDMLIKNGLSLNQKWQNGEAAVFEVWQAGLEIYKSARNCHDLNVKTALTAVSQAIASVQMKEHALMAADFSVRLVNLLHPDNAYAVAQERMWQLDCLKNVRAA